MKARYHVREAFLWLMFCIMVKTISFSVVSKTVFQRIGPLLEIAKFVSFIVDLGTE